MFCAGDLIPMEVIWLSRMFHITEKETLYYFPSETNKLLNRDKALRGF